jgi:DNA helicase-2/ATP-dependent DNA helicase PcrA
VNDTGHKVGAKVKHFKFGEGVVTNFEGSGEKSRVQVNFVDFGSKWLLVSLAKLERC